LQAFSLQVPQPIGWAGICFLFFR